MTNESWRYEQRLRSQREREYDAEVIYLDGEPGRRLARDLAAVTAELLTWARDDETTANAPALHDHHHRDRDRDLGEAA